MAINIVEGLRHSNSARFAVIDIEDLLLDVENPRFASSGLIANQTPNTQSTIINYLIKYGELLPLARSINENEGLFNETIISVYVKDGKAIVLEGNRRIAACKILLDNGLVDKELQALHPIPMANKETKENIRQINVVVYDDSADAQKYIASKHTQPDVKKWTTVEQYNYYYTQFLRGKRPHDIAREVGVKDVKKVEERIRQYILFKKMFDLVQAEKTSLRVETTSILPVVSAFMPKILGSKGEYALNIEMDTATLQYKVLPSQIKLYNKILLSIGKAFFARPEAKKLSELKERALSDAYRVSTEEVKGKEKAEKLIRDDIRIPGLKLLIHEFRNDEECTLAQGQGDGKPLAEVTPALGNTVEPRKNDALDPVTDQHVDKPTSTVQSESDSTKSIETPDDNSPKKFSMLEKQISFFADLKTDHLDPRNPDNRGLIAVAKEIRTISSEQTYTAYYKYPIASTFLLRSLIEQVLTCQLKSVGSYNNLLGSSGKATVALGKMIEFIKKQCKNGNISVLNNDSILVKDFNSCFEGAGTKDQLDKVVHRPAECEPDKIFLDNLAKQGLKGLLQKIINSL